MLSIALSTVIEIFVTMIVDTMGRHGISTFCQPAQVLLPQLADKCGRGKPGTSNTWVCATLSATRWQHAVNLFNITK